MGDILPSAIDGLKESERLVFYGALKKRRFDEVEVAEVAKNSYAFTPRQKYQLPRRRTSIVGMAQNFPGTNNINLFVPIGDFGCQYLSGIPDGNGLVTKLNPMLRMLFHEDDDLVAFKFLDGCEKCGRLPKWLLPVIPLILVNGTDCRVLKFRSYVPSYKPKDIVANLRCLLKNESMKPMVPWFDGFKGSIEACPDDSTRFIVTGALNNINSQAKTVDIVELPIGTWLQDYINLLEDGSIPNKGYEDLSNFPNLSLCLRIHLLDQEDKLDTNYLLERLQLTSTIKTDAMYLIDGRGMTHKFDSPLEVIFNFYHHRFPLYGTRKKLVLDNIIKQLDGLMKEVEDASAIANQCINGIKLMKGKLPQDLKMFFDDFITENVGKLNMVTVAIDYIDEAENLLSSALEQIVKFEKIVSVVSDVNKPDADTLLLVQTAGNWIKRPNLVLQTLRRLYTDKRELMQKIDQLKQTDISALWLTDLDRLEECLTEQDLLSVEELSYERGFM